MPFKHSLMYRGFQRIFHAVLIGTEFVGKSNFDAA